MIAPHGGKLVNRIADLPRPNSSCAKGPKDFAALRLRVAS